MFFLPSAASAIRAMACVPVWIVVSALEHCRWYRRWRGGHWELWWVDDPIGAQVWHHLPCCHKEATTFSGRPSTLCRGTPLCEDYPWRC
jgi:hypothetical protein